MTSNSAPEQPAGRPADWLRPLRRHSDPCSWHLTPSPILDVIVQEVWRRHLGIMLYNLVVLALDIGFEDGLVVRGKRAFEGFLVRGHQIDAKFVRQRKHVTPGMAVSL